MLLAVAAALALLAALWRWTPLGAWVTPRALGDALLGLRGSPWAVPVVWGRFVGAGFLAIPITGLFVAVGLVSDVRPAVALSLSGGLWSALALQQAGRRLDLEPLLRRAPERLRRLKRQHLEEASVLELALLRFLPLGPFATMNLLWGAAGVGRWQLVVASCIGLLPGAVVTALLGQGLGRSARDPSLGAAALVLVSGLALLGMLWLGKRLFARWSG